MRIVILANDRQKEEWLSKGKTFDMGLTWVSNHSEFLQQEADAYFNLLFETDGNNIDAYSKIAAPIFLNQVIHPFEWRKKKGGALFRLNAWPGFLKREIIELAAADPENIPGLISARVIATVINEAYFTLQQEVSTKEEIDIAMKLGTNYPYGPFEWSEVIGLGRIYQLLLEMSKADERYLPAELLRKEAEQKVTWH